jgi:hypothetical protein
MLFIRFLIYFRFWQRHFNHIGIGQRGNNQKEQQQKEHDVTH